MKEITSIDDQMRGVVTVELRNGKRCQFAQKEVRLYGLADMLRYAGFGGELPTERLPVYQSKRKIGTMAADFDPARIKSRSWLYEPREGDFRLEGDRWIANEQLGPGDLESIAGFAWEPE